MAARVLRAVLSLLCTVVSRCQPVISWFKPPTYSFPSDEIREQFRGRQRLFDNASEPAYTLSSAETGKLFVLGVMEYDTPRFGKVAPLLWVSQTGGNSWFGKLAPEHVAVRKGAAVAAFRNDAGYDCICVVGGRVLVGTVWAATDSVACTFDGGDTWLDQAPLPIAISFATLAHGPFGTWLVGGVATTQTTLGRRAQSMNNTDGPPVVGGPGSGPPDGVGEGPYQADVSWVAILNAVWDTSGRSIVDWGVVTESSPLGPRLYPCVAWAWTTRALYMTAGYIPDVQGSDGELERADQEPARVLWRVHVLDSDVSQSSSWIATGKVPFVSAWSKGAEPESLMVELLSTRMSWNQHPGPWYNYTAEALAALASGDPREPSLPIMAYVSAGVTYGSLNFGTAGWVYTQPLTHATFTSTDSVGYYMRSMAVLYRPSPLITNLTVSIVGTGLVADGRGTPALQRQLVEAFPIWKCQNPCKVGWPNRPLGGGASLTNVYSTGCTNTPWDSLCSSCAMESRPACEGGVTFKTKDCGTWADNFGHPQPDKCVPCTVCGEHYVAVQACNVVNDTICELRPVGPAIYHNVPEINVTAGESTVLWLLLCVSMVVGMASCTVRLVSGRTVRRTVTGMCAWAPLCPAGIQLPAAFSKPVRDGAVSTASAAMSVVLMAVQFALGAAAIASATDDQRSGSNGALVAGVAMIFVPLQVVAGNVGYMARTGLGSKGTATWQEFGIALCAALHARTGMLHLLRQARTSGTAIGEAGPEANTARKQDPSSLLRQLSHGCLWMGVSLVLVDLQCVVAGMAMFIATLPSYDTPMALPQDVQEGVRRASALACVAAVHAFCSFLFTLHVLSLARTRMKLMAFAARMDSGKGGMEVGWSTEAVLADGHGAGARASHAGVMRQQHAVDTIDWGNAFATTNALVVLQGRQEMDVEPPVRPRSMVPVSRADRLAAMVGGSRVNDAEALPVKPVGEVRSTTGSGPDGPEGELQAAILACVSTRRAGHAQLPPWQAQGSGGHIPGQMMGPANMTFQLPLHGQVHDLPMPLQLQGPQHSGTSSSQPGQLFGYGDVSHGLVLPEAYVAGHMPVPFLQQDLVGQFAQVLYQELGLAPAADAGAGPAFVPMAAMPVPSDWAVAHPLHDDSAPGQGIRAASRPMPPAWPGSSQEASDSQHDTMHVRAVRPAARLRPAPVTHPSDGEMTSAGYPDCRPSSMSAGQYGGHEDLMYPVPYPPSQDASTRPRDAPGPGQAGAAGPPSSKPEQDKGKSDRDADLEASAVALRSMLQTSVTANPGLLQSPRVQQALGHLQRLLVNGAHPGGAATVRLGQDELEISHGSPSRAAASNT